MNNLLCSVNGHDYKVTKEITNSVKEYICIKCKKEFTTSSEGDLTLLTNERKEINRLLEHIHQKKQKRQLISYDIRSWIEAY
ncbi:hypothetical protein [Aegicerativicinus sediminis]|uniref:hypothetical protein n=1 Tax=Aegicerativicinus sediminis TaxID=2893202 RepID=UPI001E548666|nr:hypothetical protein [Aegicerativicinus sediminis]